MINNNNCLAPSIFITVLRIAFYLAKAHKSNAPVLLIPDMRNMTHLKILIDIAVVAIIAVHCLSVF